MHSLALSLRERNESFPTYLLRLQLSLTAQSKPGRRTRNILPPSDPKELLKEDSIEEHGHRNGWPQCIRATIEPLNRLNSNLNRFSTTPHRIPIKANLPPEPMAIEDIFLNPGGVELST